MKLKYNWEKYPKVINLLTKIYKNSITSLGNKYTEEFIYDIEDFLYYMFTLNK